MQCLSERALLLTLLTLGCAVLFTLVSAGEKIRFKIHVPELIKHQHHTNVVFVHKYDDDDHQHYHHNGGGAKSQNHKHKNPHGSKQNHHYDYKNEDLHAYKPNPYGYSFSDQYTFGDPDSNKYTHHYDHEHHYSFSQNYENDGNNKQKPSHPKYENIKNIGKPEAQKKLNNKPKKTKVKYSAPLNDHYSHTSFIPINPFNENNVRETNHSFKHESIEIETNGGIPEVKHFNDFSISVKDGYEVEEPSADFQDEPLADFKEESSPELEEPQDNRNLKYVNPYMYAQKEENEENKEKKQQNYFQDYLEDYTNPNSVAKYTSSIKHGDIGLEDSNYGPYHSNDLENYIRGFKDDDKNSY